MTTRMMHNGHAGSHGFAIAGPATGGKALGVRTPES